MRSQEEIGQAHQDDPNKNENDSPILAAAFSTTTLTTMIPFNDSNVVYVFMFGFLIVYCSWDDLWMLP